MTGRTLIALLLVPLAAIEAADARLRGTFQQGLWRGEDPRITHHNGSYYYVENASGQGPRVIYRSKSLIDRGEPRPLPEGFPLFAPIYVETLNGATYKKWFAFDTQGVLV